MDVMKQKWEIEFSILNTSPHKDFDSSVVIAFTYASLPDPQITQTPYTLHSFLLCSHSEALVSNTALKEFPVEAHCSLGLALYMCACALHYHQLSPSVMWPDMTGCDADETMGSNTSLLRTSAVSPHNPSLTEHFLHGFLPPGLSLSPILHIFSTYCQS